MVQTIWGSLVHWFVSVPPGGEAKDALIVIASVAAVVWTGGLITMQLRQGSIALGNGLDFLQSAFMGTALALFVVGVPLRAIVLVFAIFYTIKSVRELSQGMRLRGIARREGPMTIVVTNLGAAYAEPYGKASVQYSATTLLSMLGYVAVIVWPTQFTVSVFGWLMMFLGLQLILVRLYDPQAMTVKKNEDKS
jgi:hypothetical protein